MFNTAISTKATSKFDQFYTFTRNNKTCNWKRTGG